MNKFEECNCLEKRIDFKYDDYVKCSKCRNYYPKECFYPTKTKYRITGVKAYCIDCDHKDRTNRNHIKKGKD